MTNHLQYDIMSSIYEFYEVLKMSEKLNRYIPCPKCSQQSDTEIVCSMNTVSNPDIRKLVFEENIFRWKCPKCGFRKKLMHPFLYNDIENKFMIYYIPNVERRQLADDKTEKEFSELSYIKKRIVSDTNTMKEKIVIFEKGINDMAIELTKYAVSEVVAKSTGLSVSAGYFTDMDTEKNTVSFQFFVGADSRSYLQTTRLEVYNRSLDIVKKYFSNEEKRSGFLNIDRVWAKDALQKYKNSK